MTDSDSSKTSAGSAEQAEPSSSPTAPAAAPRGLGLIGRVKQLLTLRTGSVRDDLEVALESDASGETADFTASERTILQNVLHLQDKRVDDVMVPRADIEAIEEGETLGGLVAQFREIGHSRIPVYRETIDDIIGFVHVKDALRRITETPKVEPHPEGEAHPHSPVKLVSSPLRSKLSKLGITRQVLFVPPSMPVGDLLQSMQQKRLHMAIIIDEYGGTDGLVTIEDLLEAVVGEIEDEHDDLEAALVRKVNSNIFVASARAELSEVQQVIGPEFDPGPDAADIDTLGGLVFDLAGHVPKKGEVVIGPSGFDFEVMQSDGRSIKRVKIRRRQRARKPAGVVKAANTSSPAEGSDSGDQKTAAE